MILSVAVFVVVPMLVLKCFISMTDVFKGACVFDILLYAETHSPQIFGQVSACDSATRGFEVDEKTQG